MAKFKSNGHSKTFTPRQQQPSSGNKNLFEIKIPKIILRNLSFKINEEVLKNEMSKYGTVVDVLIPKKADGKLCGYGFVKFVEMNEASKAMSDLNGRKESFHGTNVAVDWCLPKNLFLKNTSN
jgi:nucleolar protein 4